MKNSILAVCLAMVLVAFAGCSSEKPVSSDVPSNVDTGSSSVESTESPISSSRAAESGDETLTSSVKLTNEEMGFEVYLPDMLAGKITEESSTYEAHDETVKQLFVVYNGESGKANLMSFEEMSKETWEAIKAEGGPVGVELGVSSNDRVIVFNMTQSNPFPENTKDFEELNDFPKQLKIIAQSFKFLK